MESYLKRRKNSMEYEDEFIEAVGDTAEVYDEVESEVK